MSSICYRFACNYLCVCVLILYCGFHLTTFCAQVILQRDFHVINALALVCGQDRTLLASILLRIFRHEKAEAPLLRTLNDREINMEGTVLDCFLYYISGV